MLDELAIWTAFVAAATLFICWAAQSVLRIGPQAAVGIGPYLTQSAGRTTLLTGPQRRAHWRQAFAYVSRLLRTRKRFHRIGQLLQLPRVKDLFSGITRVKGELHRSAAAETPCPTTSVTQSTRARPVTARARQAR